MAELLAGDPLQHLTVVCIMVCSSNFFVNMVLGDFTPLQGKQGCRQSGIFRRGGHCITLYISRGIRISNFTPLPVSPFSRMVMLVIARISRDRNRPRPVCLPNPLRKIRSLSPSGIPDPHAPSVIH